MLELQQYALQSVCCKYNWVAASACKLPGHTFRGSQHAVALGIFFDFFAIHVMRKAAGTGTGPGVRGQSEASAAPAAAAAAAAGAADAEEGTYVLLDLASLGRLKLADNIMPGQNIQIQVIFSEAGATYCMRTPAADADAALGTPSPPKLDLSCSLEPPSTCSASLLHVLFKTWLRIKQPCNGSGETGRACLQCMAVRADQDVRDTM